MAKNLKKSLSMIHYQTLMVLGALLLLGAVGCQVGSTQITETQFPEQDQTEVSQSPDPTAVETETVDLEEAVEADPPNQCLVCHTDEQALKDTAKPVVDKESESSGEG